MLAGMIMRPRATLARIVHLREVAIRVFLLTPGKPLGARPGDAVAVAVIAVRSIGGSHRVHTFLISKLYPSPPFPPNRADPECSVPPPGLLTRLAQLRISRYAKGETFLCVRFFFVRYCCS